MWRGGVPLPTGVGQERGCAPSPENFLLFSTNMMHFCASASKLCLLAGLIHITTLLSLLALWSNTGFIVHPLDESQQHQQHNRQTRNNNQYDILSRTDHGSTVPVTAAWFCWFCDLVDYSTV